mgnify:CR=1 FL=1
MPVRKQRARIAKSHASKMWMESLEQRQLWAPIGGEFAPLAVSDGLVIAHRTNEATSSSAVWIADQPRNLPARRDDDSAGTTDGVVVMAL